MKRYLSRALPITTILVLLTCSGALRAQTRHDCTNPGPKCAIAINVATANCNNSTVQYDETHFPRTVNGKPNRMILVEWTLPSGYGFCPQPAVGDGVFLKSADPHDQFTPKGFGSSSGSAPCNRKSVKLQAKNSKPGLRYDYRIQFHSEDGTKTCTIDPAMFND